jgi:ribosomal protein L12E/L44/L45/RPP1/RPP2
VGPEEQKHLLKQVISKIVVEREKKVVQFFVRRVPAVSVQLEELLQNKKAATQSVTAEGSGGPNFSAVTFPDQLFELAY